MTAKPVFTYLQGRLKLKSLVTHTKHLQIAFPFRPRHERFTYDSSSCIPLRCALHSPPYLRSCPLTFGRFRCWRPCLIAVR